MSTESYPKKQKDDPIETVGIYEEDEIKLLDYLIVIWNRKWFILTATVLPTLAVALLLFLSPRSYTMSYSYDVKNGSSNRNLNEKNFNVMLSRFYSEENLTKLADQMQQAGLVDYATKILNFIPGSPGFVEFETKPPFFDISKLNVNGQTQLKDILNMQASLLNVKIVGKQKAEMQKISSVIRDNIENVISLYPVQDELESTIRSYNNSLAKIQGSRFSSLLDLKQHQDILTGLRNIKPGELGNSESNITLQYNIGSHSQFLPLSYQIQAAETKIVALKEEIVLTEAKYKYYTDLVNLNESFLAELNDKKSGGYSIGEFKTFLATLSETTEKTELKDYLNSYRIGIQNMISASKPVTETPRIFTVARGTVKKSVIVLVIASMFSVFTAFLLESMKNSGAGFLDKRFKLNK